MNRQMYWGIAALIIILIAAGGFIYWQLSTVQQLKEQLAQDEKLLEERDKPVAENKPPRPAREGYKWVPHGDHFHEVPLSAPDTWQEQTPLVENGMTTKSIGVIAPHEIPSAEELARVRAFQKKQFPIHLEILDQKIAGLEELYNKALEYTNENPDDEFWRKRFAQAQKRLKSARLERSGFQKRLDEILNVEENNAEE